jgi:hypothetical protein
MRKLLFSIASFFLITFCLAQDLLTLKKWNATVVEAVNGAALPVDVNKQIINLEIKSRAEDKGTYNGLVEYGSNSNSIVSTCTITINGKNINIRSKRQNWSGIILEVETDKMLYELGSLRYHFKLVVVPVIKGGGELNYSPENFYGNWQEVSRKNASDKTSLNIGNSDTVYFRLSKTSAMYRPGTAFAPMTGSMDIKENNLNVAYNDFKIVSLTNEVMLLENYGKSIMTFVKISKPFYWEINHNAPPVKLIDLSPESLIKNWYAFRISPSNAAQETDAISSFVIKNRNEDSSYAGNISFGKWNDKNVNTLPCTFSFTKNKLNIKASSINWYCDISKANGDTIIISSKGVTYHLKKLEAVQPALVDTGTMVIDLRDTSLKHDWQVYKAEAVPGFIKTENAIIRKLNIQSSETILKYKGEVTFDMQGKRLTRPCTIAFNVDSQKKVWINIVDADGNIWTLELFKADGKEMIFGRYPEAIRYSLNIN